MKKRGFVIGWQNRRWINKASAYERGQYTPGILPGGGGSGGSGGVGSGGLPDYFTFEQRGIGWSKTEWYEDEEWHIRWWISEYLYTSPPFFTDSGDCFRFVVSYYRSTEGGDASATFGIVKCSADGRLSDNSGSTERNEWNIAIGLGTTKYNTVVLASSSLPSSKWHFLEEGRKPDLSVKTAQMLQGDKPQQFYKDAFASTGSVARQTHLLTVRAVSGVFWEEFPFTISETSPEVAQIISRGQSLRNYKYVYGGAGQYSSTYGRRIADCSWLVGYAYGVLTVGNHDMFTGNMHDYFSVWNGAPKDGMILWRTGHTALYYQGHTIEMANSTDDYKEQPYNPSKWSAILYNPNIRY